MRARLALLAGGAAVAAGALVGFLRRHAETSTPPSAPVDPRAEELRQKLAESREVADDRADYEGAETSIDAVEPVESVDELRRDVHARGRASAERMRRGT